MNDCATNMNANCRLPFSDSTFFPRRKPRKLSQYLLKIFSQKTRHDFITHERLDVADYARGDTKRWNCDVGRGGIRVARSGRRHRDSEPSHPAGDGGPGLRTGLISAALRR